MPVRNRDGSPYLLFPIDTENPLNCMVEAVVTVPPLVDTPPLPPLVPRAWHNVTVPVGIVAVGAVTELDVKQNSPLE